jgi:hypothetical protein
LASVAALAVLAGCGGSDSDEKPPDGGSGTVRKAGGTATAPAALRAKGYVAEAVFVVSDKPTTWRVVHGMERLGIPAFGPIWDS